MLKTHKETETCEITVVDDVVCNKCGKSVRTVPENQVLPPVPISALEYVSISTQWGFNSKKDLTQQLVEICEPCWDAFCETFSVPPLETDYEGSLLEDKDPQLMLFTWEELSGDPDLIAATSTDTTSVCGFLPSIPGYEPCTRSAGHSGPCAHHFTS